LQAQAVAAALAQHPTAAVPGLGALPAIAMPTADALAAAAAGAALPPPIISLPASIASSLVTVGSGAIRTAAQESAARKAREIYIGNLAIGQTTADVLRELFNAALVGFLDNPSKQQAVAEIKMDPGGCLVSGGGEGVAGGRRRAKLGWTPERNCTCLAARRPPPRRHRQRHARTPPSRAPPAPSRPLCLCGVHQRGAGHAGADA
jgi:hypothetical protein